MPSIVYPELSYKIIGITFKIFNQIGYGYQEKHYQRALASEFGKQGIKYEREKEIEIKYNNELIGKYYLDFLVEDKMILELKVVPEFQKRNLRQTLEYLNTTGLKLAILINFTLKGVQYRRVINPNIKV